MCFVVCLHFVRHVFDINGRNSLEIVLFSLVDYVWRCQRSRRTVWTTSGRQTDIYSDLSFVYTVSRVLSNTVWCESWQIYLSTLRLRVLQNAFVEELVTDIIDDVTCGFCFEIHRACKLGILFLDETDPELVPCCVYKALFSSHAFHACRVSCDCHALCNLWLCVVFLLYYVHFLLHLFWMLVVNEWLCGAGFICVRFYLTWVYKQYNMFLRLY